jgi:hypothetical protein
MLNKSVRTVERIWKIAKVQMQRGEEVDVSNKKRAMLVKKEGPISIEGCHNRAQQKEDHSRSSKIIGCEPLSLRP